MTRSLHQPALSRLAGLPHSLFALDTIGRGRSFMRLPCPPLTACFAPSSSSEDDVQSLSDSRACESGGASSQCCSDSKHHRDSAAKCPSPALHPLTWGGCTTPRYRSLSTHARCSSYITSFPMSHSSQSNHMPLPSILFLADKHCSRAPLSA
jgi:hypothetical protein